MKNDTLIRKEGMEVLMEKLGLVEAERFIMLIQREPFDYTSWQENLFEDKNIESIFSEAAALRAKTKKMEKAQAKSRKVKASTKAIERRKTAKRLTHT